MRVTIVTPYRHSEVTYQALRLAEFASAHVDRLTVLAIGRRSKRPVDLAWDHRCRALRARSFAEVARRTDQWVWFEPCPILTGAARRHCPGAKHLVVPDWGGLAPRRAGRLLRVYDEVLCCSHAMLQAADRVRDKGARGRPALLRSLPPVLAEASSLAEGDTRMLVIVDTPTMRAAGDGLLYLLGALLGEISTLRLTLLCLGTWPKRIQRMAETAQTAFRQRFEFRCRPLWQEITEEMYRHHVLLYLPMRAPRGFVAAEAAVRGLPTIAFDISPLGEIVDGKLLKTAARNTLLDAPHVTFSVMSVLEQLRKLLLGGEPWVLGRRTRRFLREVGRCRAFWLRRWGIADSESGPCA